MSMYVLYLHGVIKCDIDFMIKIGAVKNTEDLIKRSIFFLGDKINKNCILINDELKRSYNLGMSDSIPVADDNNVERSEKYMEIYQQCLFNNVLSQYYQITLDESYDKVIEKIYSIKVRTNSDITKEDVIIEAINVYMHVLYRQKQGWKLKPREVVKQESQKEGASMKFIVHWDEDDEFRITAVQGKCLVTYDGLPELVRKAVDVATEAHRGQYRKDDKTPYIVHPWCVLYIAVVCDWHFTDEELAAFVMHDIVEDTRWPYNDKSYELDVLRSYQYKYLLTEFNIETASIVYLLTKPLGEKFRQEIYMMSLRRVAPSVICGKLADGLHNLMDLPNAATTTSKRKVKCHECGGTGKEISCGSEEVECSVCSGTGYVNDKFSSYFKNKVRENVYPLIGVLRMHGPAWESVANWFETRFREYL